MKSDDFRDLPSYDWDGERIQDELEIMQLEFTLLISNDPTVSFRHDLGHLHPWVDDFLKRRVRLADLGVFVSLLLVDELAFLKILSSVPRYKEFLRGAAILSISKDLMSADIERKLRAYSFLRALLCYSADAHRTFGYKGQRFTYFVN